MRHLATDSFWSVYETLPPKVRALADKNFALLKENPRHPSLHFKKVGTKWSVRVGLNYRALGVESNKGLVWFWIGTHTEYDTLIRS